MSYRIANFKVLAHNLTSFVTSIILYPRIMPKRIVSYVRIVKSAVTVHISVIVTPLVRFQNYFALIFLVTEWTDCESLMKATAFIRDEVQFYHAEPVVIFVLKYRLTSLPQLRSCAVDRTGAKSYPHVLWCLCRKKKSNLKKWRKRTNIHYYILIIIYLLKFTAVTLCSKYIMKLY